MNGIKCTSLTTQTGPEPFHIRTLAIWRPLSAFSMSRPRLARTFSIVLTTRSKLLFAPFSCVNRASERLALRPRSRTVKVSMASETGRIWSARYTTSPRQSSDHNDFRLYRLQETRLWRHERRGKIRQTMRERPEKIKSKGLTIVHPNPRPYSPRRLVHHDIPHPVSTPLSQQRHHLFPRSHAVHLERHHCYCGLDPKEFHQPVLVLGVNLSWHDRCRHRQSRFVVDDLAIQVCILLVAMTTNARGTLVLKGTTHEVRSLV